MFAWFKARPRNVRVVDKAFKVPFVIYIDDEKEIKLLIYEKGLKIFCMTRYCCDVDYIKNIGETP